MDELEPWRTLDAEAMALFSPSAPIDEADLFAGRQDQLRRLMDLPPAHAARPYQDAAADPKAGRPAGYVFDAVETGF